MQEVAATYYGAMLSLSRAASSAMASVWSLVGLFLCGGLPLQCPVRVRVIAPSEPIVPASIIPCMMTPLTFRESRGGQGRLLRELPARRRRILRYRKSLQTWQEDLLEGVWGDPGSEELP